MQRCWLSIPLLKFKAFTLIELVVVITIMVLVWLVSYMNFAYSQNKMNLKLTAKDISQSLYNARNMAINWYDSNSWNVSIWVYFDKNSKNNIKIYSYNYNLNYNSEDLLIDRNRKLIKNIKFNKSIELNDVDWKDRFLFLFNAISWSWYYYYWDNNNIKKEFSWEDISINISFKWAKTWNLTKKIRYIVWTNIIDY